ncbi:PQQ-binding-like beta-propeller repeat protein [Micromonospora sp. NPDC000668]|uniref:outer membrane protein assembly factor BamB family protein n=1 Tax=Micromonospora sp. NPDC000668 TaxID=3364219 RepID=UPI0036AF7355
MSIIELGEVREEPASAPPVHRPRAAGRPLRCAAVLLVALVALASAAPVPRRTETPVPASPGARAYLTEDGIFVIDASSAGGDRHITAYAQPAAGGEVRRRWQAPLAGVGDYLGIRDERGLVLLTGVSAGDGQQQTTAFDAATGEQRWRRPGIGSWTADGGLLLSATDEGSGAVSRVAPDTGRALWSVPVPPPGNVSYHGGIGEVDRFVLLQPTGELQVHDAGTGRLLRSIDTLPGDRSALQQAQVVGDLLLLAPPGHTRLEGYGLSELDRRWTAEVPLVSFVLRCGSLLCAFQHTGGIQAFDPATGAVRWSRPGGDMLADVRDGRLLMIGPLRRYTALDTTTGRTGTDLGQWDLVPVLRPDDPLIGVRQGNAGQLVVAELDLVAGRSRIIDVLSGVSNDCKASQAVLLCRRLDGSTALWRLRP